VVFGARVVECARADAPGPVPAGATPEGGGEPEGEARGLRAELRQLAWRRLGLVRDRAGLAEARARLAELWRALPPGPGETRNLVFAGTLVAAAAERREESRGAHFRSDFPAPRPEWRARQMATASVTDDAIAVELELAAEPERT
jgi:L-aspartate oxidase